MIHGVGCITCLASTIIKAYLLRNTHWNKLECGKCHCVFWESNISENVLEKELCSFQGSGKLFQGDKVTCFRDPVYSNHNTGISSQVR